MRELDEAPLHLSVPNNPTYLRLVRLVVASCAADVNFSYDAIEDLRIVADELTNLVMMAAAPETPIRFGIFPGKEFFEFRSSALLATLASFEQAGNDAGSAIEHQEFRLDVLATQIVASLVDTYEIENRDGRIEVAFSVRCPIGPSDG